MDESTTTEASTQEPGALDAQPVAEQQTEAVSTTTEEPNFDDPDEGTTTPSEEPASADNPSDSDKWLAAKGIDPKSPDAVHKLAEMARNSEKAMHKSTQERAQAQRELSSAFDKQGENQDDLKTQVKNLELNQMARDFVDRHPDDKEQMQEFGKFFKANPHIMQMTEAGLLTMDQSYAIYQSSPAQADKLRAEGGREALQSLADTQRAAAVSGSATSPEPTTPEPEDDFMKGFNNPY